MRYLIHASVVLASLQTPGVAQGVIRGPEQSVEAGSGPAFPESVPVAVDGDSLSVYSDTFQRVGGAWLPAGSLLGDTRAVDADGGRFVTGNERASFTGVSRLGVARVQSRTASGWQIDELLLPSDQRTRMNFGADVAVSGDTVAVLAAGWRPMGQGPDEAVGAVFVYREAPGGWVEEALLTPRVGDRFQFPLGAAFVALDGNTLTVTGGTAFPGGGSRPAVFVFERDTNGWSQVAALVLPIGSGAAGIGMQVDVQEDASGAITRIATKNVSFGSAVVFTGSGGTWQSQTLAEETGGGGISFSGELLAVGDAAISSAAGAVAFYQLDGSGAWQFRNEVATIEPSDQLYFGTYLDFDGDLLAVGSGRNLGGSGSLSRTVDVFRALPVGTTQYCYSLGNSTGQDARTGRVSVAV